MKREDALDALVIDNSPDREAFVNAPPFAGDDRAREDLRTLFVALFDTAVNIDDIAYLEMRDCVLETSAFNSIQQFRFH